MLRNPKRGGEGPYWAVEPYDDYDDDDDDVHLYAVLGVRNFKKSVHV
jgi:hypothetical protein